MKNLSIGDYYESIILNGSDEDIRKHLAIIEEYMVDFPEPPILKGRSYVRRQSELLKAELERRMEEV